MAAPLLEAVFGAVGAKGIAFLVEDFDFSKMNVRDNTRDDYLHTGLAPLYDTLTSESIKELDDELKVMITGTMKSLAQIPPRERTWNKVLSAMLQNPVLEPDSSNQIARADRILKEKTNVFKLNGSPEPAIVQEVEGWFINLIRDDEVLKGTSIDIKVLANIVAWTGATIDSFPTAIYKDERHEKTMVDIGVLRFPEKKRPHFQLYRIQLTAWSESKRIFMVQHDTNGISGEYHSHIFLPYADVINRLSHDATDKAVDEANKLLG